MKEVTSPTPWVSLICILTCIPVIISLNNEFTFSHYRIHEKDSFNPIISPKETKEERRINTALIKSRIDYLPLHHYSLKPFSYNRNLTLTKENNESLITFNFGTKPLPEFKNRDSFIQKKVKTENISTDNLHNLKRLKIRDTKFVQIPTEQPQNTKISLQRDYIYLQCNQHGTGDPQNWKSHLQCPCKEHVTGKYCNVCKKHSFYLSKQNEKGCITCFCMNLSRTCDSSALKRKKIKIKKLSCVTKEKPREIDITKDKGKFNSKTERVYCQFPKELQGDKITSYGGKLSFKTKHIRLRGPLKLYLKGGDVTLESRVRRRTKKGKVFVGLVENEWRVKVPDSRYRKASRSDLMLALAEINSFVLSARKFKRPKTALLRNVKMEIAVNKSQTGARAFEVENCTCPIGYMGSSCHLCAPGYHKEPVESPNPDGIFFACHKIRMEDQDDSANAIQITFLLQTSREINKLSYNLPKQVMIENFRKPPIKLYLRRNNSITILKPYKQVLLTNNRAP